MASKVTNETVYWLSLREHLEHLEHLEIPSGIFNNPNSVMAVAAKKI
jgi:hypothetical protein